jgi:NitT/TauT family transport system permease protein
MSQPIDDTPDVATKDDTPPPSSSPNASTSPSAAELAATDLATADLSAVKLPQAAPKEVIIAGAHSSEAMRVGDLGKKQKPPGGGGILDAFMPNRAISPMTMRLLIGVEVLLALAIWIFSPYEVLPKPGEVLAALQSLWMERGLGQELPVSFALNLKALGWSSLISLGLAYLTVIPAVRPIVAAISKGRFLSLTGFSLIFTIMLADGSAVKTALLTLSITVFYITSMASVIAAIPKSEFDHARTLRMSEWRVVWEVVILGTADKVFDVLRQNAAIGWMMLTMVEGISRAEGGVGTMLLAQSKHMRLADLFAIQLLILIVGLLQDYAIGVARRLACPYADLTLERK